MVAARGPDSHLTAEFRVAIYTGRGARHVFGVWQRRVAAEDVVGGYVDEQAASRREGSGEYAGGFRVETPGCSGIVLRRIDIGVGCAVHNHIHLTLSDKGLHRRGIRNVQQLCLKPLGSHDIRKNELIRSAGRNLAHLPAQLAVRPGNQNSPFHLISRHDCKDNDF